MSLNPYQPLEVDEPLAVQPQRSLRDGVVELLVVLSILTAMAILVLPAVQAARDRLRRLEVRGDSFYTEDLREAVSPANNE